METAMKVQDVMFQAMAKKVSWRQAAEILGISDRHMRWRATRKRVTTARVPVGTVEKVFALYQGKYFDLNMQHFHETLQAEHGIELSYTWVKQALQRAGMVAREHKRGAHRKRRSRRPLPGTGLGRRRGTSPPSPAPPPQTQPNPIGEGTTVKPDISHATKTNLLTCYR